MANRNLYLTYKKDTSRLLHWIINTSNGIVRSSASAEDCAPVTINTTGQSTVSDIVNMSKLIAKSAQPVPSAIFGLFQAVIKARSTTYNIFRQIVDHKPDPEIERSNVTHKYFIDSLTEAFDALGGKIWSSRKGSKAGGDEDEDAEEQIPQNKFSMLSLGQTKGNDESDALSEDDLDPSATGPRKKTVAKRNKGKRGKKSKKKPATKPTAEASLADVPVESYRIIEDKEGLGSEYLFALYAVIREWSQLRSFVQDLWREVAYDGLNSAVAASMTNLAVAMVKQTCIAVFADFPGYESYETIIKTFTRGDPDKAQGRFSIGLYQVSDCGHQTNKVQDNDIDIKEQFWIHTYNNLVDFIVDFQKNRSGKPTKAMQAQINNWNPNFDLQRATTDERLNWRRSYTINWLYDLVNVFSSIVVQRNTMKGEKHVYENVDWSTTGPWHHHRRIFGLNEFAGVITTFAMQKPNTDVRQKILPHHVFQLQCIVDSLATSRGWTLSPLRGHVLNLPARNFRPRRDVDLFLDREAARPGQGCLQSIDLLKQLFESDAELHHDPNRHKELSGILDDVQFDFINWLGESKYMHGLTTIPPSRFSKHNANGLWEFSPLLCGAGLVEGLVLMQRVAMLIWDKIPEPTLAFHLYNMLVKKGYIKKPIGLYGTLQVMLQESLFPEGVPDSGFYEALKRLQLHKTRVSLRQRQAVARDLSKDVHQLLDVSLNSFFKTKSALMMYYDSNWVPESIPDSAVGIPSLLYVLRLNDTKRVTDPLTGERRLDETELVKRSKALGNDDAALLQLACIPALDKDSEGTDALLRRIDDFEDYKPIPSRDPYHVKVSKKKEVQGCDLLNFLRPDIFADVCGNNPLSSMNYIWIAVNIMMLFMEIERQFREARHPLYVRAFENTPPSLRNQKRAAFVIAVMAEEDDEVLKLIAEVFEKLRAGVLSCIFWEGLREGESGVKPDFDDVPMDECSVM